MAQLFVVVLVDEALRTFESLKRFERLLAPFVLGDGRAVHSFDQRLRIHTVVDNLYLRHGGQLATLIVDFLRANELQIRRSCLVVVVAFSGLNSLQHIFNAMV